MCIRDRLSSAYFYLNHYFQSGRHTHPHGHQNWHHRLQNVFHYHKQLKHPLILDVYKRQALKHLRELTDALNIRATITVLQLLMTMPIIRRKSRRHWQPREIIRIKIYGASSSRTPTRGQRHFSTNLPNPSHLPTMLFSQIFLPQEKPIRAIYTQLIFKSWLKPKACLPTIFLHLKKLKSFCPKNVPTVICW